jgi:hypothetical protein
VGAIGQMTNESPAAPRVKMALVVGSSGSEVRDFTRGAAVRARIGEFLRDGQSQLYFWRKISGSESLSGEESDQGFLLTTLQGRT